MVQPNAPGSVDVLDPARNQLSRPRHVFNQHISAHILGDTKPEKNFFEGTRIVFFVFPALSPVAHRIGA